MADAGDIAARGPVLDYLFLTGIAARQPDGAIAVPAKSPAGLIAYGPYWRLHEGIYRLTIRCAAGARVTQRPVLALEIIAQNRIPILWRDFAPEDMTEGHVTADFVVPRAMSIEGSQDIPFEFKLFNLEGAELQIAAVRLDAIRAEESAFRPSRWRMQAQFRPTILGRVSGVDAISPRFATRPARFIRQALALSLPAGRYRLSFRCRADAVRDPARPVFAVEICPHRGGRLLAARDFTGEHIDGGVGELEFEVPPDLSVESGEPFYIEFPFFSFGNGLVAIEDAVVDPVAPSLEPIHIARRLLPRARAGFGTSKHRTSRTIRNSFDVRVDRLLAHAGRYRLSFRFAEVASPDEDARMIIDVRFFAQRFWSARSSRGVFDFPLARNEFGRVRDSFRADALADGRCAIYFEVPALQSRDAELTLAIAFQAAGGATAVLEEILIEPAEATEAPRSFNVATRSAAEIRVVVVGNCQAEVICQGFRCSDLGSRLRLKYHFVDLQKNLHEAGKSDIANADFILAQDISNWETYPLAHLISPSARIVKFPFLSLASPWPFDGYIGAGDRLVDRREGSNRTFTYVDSLLARLRDEIPDPEARFDAYKSLSAAGIRNALRLHALEEQRLRRLDEIHGRGIGAFILDRFRERQIFHTINHPRTPLFLMVMEMLTNAMALPRARVRHAELEQYGTTQVPIHPKIARELGIGWADEKTRYRFRNRLLTWEEYVRHYIAFYG